ncbi:dipeptidase PepV [Bacillota bacterium]
MRMKDKTDAFIEDCKEKMIEETIALIGFPSVNGRHDENRACLRYFLELADRMGFRTMTTRDYDLGIVEMGEGEETLGILVHLDVVDIGDPAKWTNGPFEGKVKDGCIWGRGAVDDKGAAVMSLYAMKAVEGLGLPWKRRVWLIVGTSEEGSWTDIEHFKEEFPLPDFGFSPDGEFPIFNAEKGYADLELLFYEDVNKGLRFLKSGDSYNTIPSKAEIIWEDGRELTAQGVAAHSSTPELGDNAIIKLCNSLGEECGLDFVSFVNDYLGGDGFGCKLGLDDGSDHLDGEFIGATTAVPTVLSLEDGGVRLVINVRQRFGTTEDNIFSALAAYTEGSRFSFEVTDYMDAMLVNKDLPFLQIMNQVHAEYGVPSGFEVAPGTSYAKSMDSFVSWGPVFQGEPSCAHVEDERLSIDSMVLATKLYSRFISRMVI